MCAPLSAGRHLLRKVRTVLTVVTICTWGLVVGRTRQGGCPLPSLSDTGQPPCAEGSPAEGGRGMHEAWGAAQDRLGWRCLEKPSIIFTFSFCVLGQLL